jgi:RecA-family ATPase
VTKFAFDPKAKIPEDQWLVEQFIPLGHLIPMLALSGVGKSFLAEALAVSVAYGKPFLGAEIFEGDVLIIDQDTPEPTLKRRLAAMAKAMGCEKKHRLDILSMENLSLKDTLIRAILQYPTAAFILIDSLNSVTGGLDRNNTNDMSVISRLKMACLRPNRTVMVTHHISQHAEVTLEDLMSGEPDGLAMGSSVLLQQADTYYILGAPAARSGKMETLYVRPIAKRQAIEYGPIILNFHDDDTGMRFEFQGDYVVTENECQEDILLLFRHDSKERTVREVYNDMREKWGIIKVRDELRELAHQGKLLERREKNNAFIYRLPDKASVKDFLHHFTGESKDNNENKAKRGTPPTESA